MPLPGQLSAEINTVTLGGVELSEGAHLLLLFASANDDEAVFTAPRTFDMDRAGLSKSMTFGAGDHLCLGISLARMQLRIAAKKVAQRLKLLHLAVPAGEIRFLPNMALLAMEELPLKFSVAELA